MEGESLEIGNGICIAVGFLYRFCDPVPSAVNFAFLFQVNLFVLLSVICVLLNLAGFILGCQGAQFVSSVPRCDLVSRHSDLHIFLRSMLHQLSSWAHKMC